MNNDKTIKYSGELDINGYKIPCFVLKDGMRVLSTTGIQTALGVTENEPEQRSSGRMDEILSSSAVKPHLAIEDEPSKYIPIECFIGKKKISAYPATILPDMCEALLKARDSGAKLGKRQLNVVAKAELIIRSLAKVGIIALVDEATGYQYEREKDALQKILKAYIAEELLPWQKTFPDVFYKEIFRLNGWDYTVSNINQRPGVVGTWTNKLIYEQLPLGVLKKLKAETPKSPSGNYTARFFQKLTLDVGNPHLQNQLASVIALMQISDDWKQLTSNFNKMVDRKNGQLELKFEDLEPKPDKKQPDANPTLFSRQIKAILTVPPPPKRNKTNKRAE